MRKSIHTPLILTIGIIIFVMIIFPFINKNDFQNIDKNADEIFLSINDVNNSNFDKLFVFNSTDDYFYDIVHIISKYEYNTRGFISLIPISGISSEDDNATMLSFTTFKNENKINKLLLFDSGEVNYNNRLYNMNNDNAYFLIEELKSYIINNNLN